MKNTANTLLLTPEEIAGGNWRLEAYIDFASGEVSLLRTHQSSWHCTSQKEHTRRATAIKLPEMFTEEEFDDWKEENADTLGSIAAGYSEHWDGSNMRGSLVHF